MHVLDKYKGNAQNKWNKLLDKYLHLDADKDTIDDYKKYEDVMDEARPFFREINTKIITLNNEVIEARRKAVQELYNSSTTNNYINFLRYIRQIQESDKRITTVPDFKLIKDILFKNTKMKITPQQQLSHTKHGENNTLNMNYLIDNYKTYF